MNIATLATLFPQPRRAYCALLAKTSSSSALRVDRIRREIDARRKNPSSPYATKKSRSPSETRRLAEEYARQQLCKLQTLFPRKPVDTIPRSLSLRATSCLPPFTTISFQRLVVSGPICPKSRIPGYYEIPELELMTADNVRCIVDGNLVFYKHSVKYHPKGVCPTSHPFSAPTKLLLIALERGFQCWLKLMKSGDISPTNERCTTLLNAIFEHTVTTLKISTLRCQLSIHLLPS
jgi:hypothetical protein